MQGFRFGEERNEDLQSTQNLNPLFEKIQTQRLLF
jgi:hypothetical protein